MYKRIRKKFKLPYGAKKMRCESIVRITKSIDIKRKLYMFVHTHSRSSSFNSVMIIIGEESHQKMRNERLFVSILHNFPRQIMFFFFCLLWLCGKKGMKMWWHTHIHTHKWELLLNLFIWTKNVDNLQCKSQWIPDETKNL